MGRLTAPEPISTGHGLDEFDCGRQTLNQWLQRQALINETTGDSRTFVTCDQQRGAGFYALATGSVRRGDAPDRVKRRMPDPLPVMVLGRLAVDRHWQKHGIGAGLLKDAGLRTLTVSRQAGIRALLVHALSESAKHFYFRYGFRESPFNPMTLMLNLTDWEVISKRSE